MALNSTQIAALKAAGLADANVTALISAGSFGAIVAYYNSAATPDYFVWNPRTSVQSIYDAMIWGNLTPVDAVPTGDQLSVNIWASRALACQGKQINIQIMLQGKDTIDATKSSTRAGIQDALTNLPSGASGALLGGGWATVKTAMQRLATRTEKIFATGSGTSASPSVMVFEGNISDYDVTQAFQQ